MPQCTIGIFLAISALTEKKRKVILSPYTIHAPCWCRVVCNQPESRPVFLRSAGETFP